MNNHEVQLLVFAQARDLLGFSEKIFAIHPSESARNLLNKILPQFVENNPSFRVAYDEEYVSWDQPLAETKTIAIIPPVSGG